MGNVFDLKSGKKQDQEEDIMCATVNTVLDSVANSEKALNKEVNLTRVLIVAEDDTGELHTMISDRRDESAVFLSTLLINAISARWMAYSDPE